MTKQLPMPHRKVLEDYARRGAASGPLKTIAQQMATIRKSRRQIREHPTMSRKEKQRRDWELARSYNEMMVRVTRDPGLRELTGARP